MALQRILDKHKDFLEASNEDRVVCRLTGHSIPARSDAVSAYVNGKQFRKAKDKAEAEMLASKHNEYIHNSKNIPDMFFCTLTNRVFAKTVSNVSKHTAGKRYLAAKEAVEGGGGVIYQEPDITEDENEDADMGSDRPDEDGNTMAEVEELNAKSESTGQNKRKQGEQSNISAKKAK